MDHESKIVVHMGFDDIDSPMGGCTTHFSALLLHKWISEKRISLIDYPNLIRLNPSIPWKTRGNGSVVLRFKIIDNSEPEDLLDEAVGLALEYTKKHEHPQHQPSIGLYIGEPSTRLKWLGKKAVNDLVPLDLLIRLLGKEKESILYKTINSNKLRGLIGVYAGIGYRMTDSDYTYELIGYRSEKYIGLNERFINPESVKKMDILYGEQTILNYDYEIDRPLIIPHGPDPVLFGIRGEDPDILLKTYNLLEIHEPVDLMVLYRTNQHTDAHIREINGLGEAYIYRGVKVRVRVHSKPKRIIGGHVIFKVSDGNKTMDAAVYEPTGHLRDIAEKLEPGDIIEVLGTVRPQSSKHGPTINLEKLHVVEVYPLVKLENPKCPRCGARMKSAGRGKGYKCPKCGYRDPHARKIVRIIKRDLEPGWYEPPPRAFKHLMKPIKRFGKEKSYFPEIYTPKRFLWRNNRLIA